MKNDELLLKEIYENSTTAINVISKLLQKAECQSMFDSLFDRMKEYRQISKTAYDMLRELNLSPKTSDYSSKIALLASFPKPSPNRLARILIIGSTEGFFSLVNSVNSCANARKETRQLAYRLMAVEDENICDMKRVLEE